MCRRVWWLQQRLCSNVSVAISWYAARHCVSTEWCCTCVHACVWGSESLTPGACLVDTLLALHSSPANQLGSVWGARRDGTATWRAAERLGWDFQQRLDSELQPASRYREVWNFFGISSSSDSHPWRGWWLHQSCDGLLWLGWNLSTQTPFKWRQSMYKSYSSTWLIAFSQLTYLMTINDIFWLMPPFTLTLTLPRFD